MKFAFLRSFKNQLIFHSTWTFISGAILLFWQGSCQSPKTSEHFRVKDVRLFPLLYYMQCHCETFVTCWWDESALIETREIAVSCLTCFQHSIKSWSSPIGGPRTDEWYVLSDPFLDQLQIIDAFLLRFFIIASRKSDSLCCLEERERRKSSQPTK